METDKENENDNYNRTNITYLSRIINIMKILVPAVFCSFMLIFEQIINMIFVGHLHNASKIAAVGLGNVMQGMICLSVMIGMNGALNTLVS